MKAVTFGGVRKLVLAEVPEPCLMDPGDVLVSVELAAICGSDLHPYRGTETGLDLGTIFGHEFIGTITEVGPGVRTWSRGDRVVAPFSTSCGQCYYCAAGLTSRCDRGQLFGWVQDGHGLHGAQAERVRVPLADSSLLRIPPGAGDVEALFTGDVLSTGTFVAELAGAGPGMSVAVLGAGPVGLMACVAAREAGARLLYALDSIPERLELARGFGAKPLDFRKPEAAEAIHEATSGRGVDAVLECVGTPGATRLAVDLVRPGGTIVAAGVHTESAFAFSPVEAYDKNLTYRAGRCPARRIMDSTLNLVAGKDLGLEAVVSHRLPLDEAVDAYRMFDSRTDGCTKVLLHP